jgi:hypothetical protein
MVEQNYIRASMTRTLMYLQVMMYCCSTAATPDVQYTDVQYKAGMSVLVNLQSYRARPAPLDQLGIWHMAHLECLQEGPISLPAGFAHVPYLSSSV